MAKMTWQKLSKRQLMKAGAMAAAFVVCGVLLLVATHAAISISSAEAESGTLNDAAVVGGDGASGGTAVRFGSGGYAHGLQALTSIDALPLLQPGIRTIGQSSYDRSGGNVDYNNFLPSVNGEKVMLNQDGPGVVYRIWTTGFDRANDWIKVYFDGESTPRINMKMADFFSGTRSPFLYPLVTNDEMSSGGFASYLPLPYARSIRITTSMSFYYNIDYKTYPSSSRITTWTGNEDSTAARNLWNRNDGRDPKSTDGNTTVSSTVNLAAGATQTVLDTAGPRSISSVKVKLPGMTPAVRATDNGRAHRGSSQFRMTVNPSNDGVTLKRRMDYTVGNQKADVYVDGSKVGTWFDSGNSANNWRDSSFAIPASFTSGRSNLTIKVQFVSSDNDWNEFTFWAYSRVNGANVLSDTLDVGDASSESQHSYTISGESWNGTRTFYYVTTPGSNNPDLLNNTRIKIFWDGSSSPAVDAPLASFFGVGRFGGYEAHTLVAGMGANGQLYMYLPMPFKSRAVVQLSNTGGTAINGVQYEIQHKPYAGNFANTGYLHAQYNAVTPSQTGQDLPFLDVSGQGTMVGFTASYQGHSEGGHNADWYLEGDERIYIDGESSPSIHGTGTEDVYDAGWYFNHGPFSRPVTATPYSGASGTTHVTAASRFYLSDSIPFTDHIKFSMEHGGGNETTNNAWTLAFYYLKH